MGTCLEVSGGRWRSRSGAVNHYVLLLGEAQARLWCVGRVKRIGPWEEWPRHPGSGAPQGTGAGAQPWHVARGSQPPLVATKQQVPYVLHYWKGLLRG